jgi:hypothetical protein
VIESWSCRYIFVYINAVADSVMLHLHDFYNIIFKTKQSIYSLRDNHPSHRKNSGCAPGAICPITVSFQSSGKPMNTHVRCNYLVTLMWQWKLSCRSRIAFHKRKHASNIFLPPRDVALTLHLLLMR